MLLMKYMDALIKKYSNGREVVEALTLLEINKEKKTRKVNN